MRAFGLYSSTRLLLQWQLHLDPQLQSIGLYCWMYLEHVSRTLIFRTCTKHASSLCFALPQAFYVSHDMCQLLHHSQMLTCRATFLSSPENRIADKMHIERHKAQVVRQDTKEWVNNGPPLTWHFLDYL